MTNKIITLNLNHLLNNNKHSFHIQAKDDQNH